jgi:AcrR family transcriptional regulator
MILHMAGKVFADGGYERASMDRIAELAGVSKPMLYAYFGSKEGLYVGYIERTGTQLLERLVSADRPQARHGDRLRALITEFLAFVREQGSAWTVLFLEMNASRPLVELVAELRGRIVAEVRRMLEGDGASWSGLTAPASEGVAEAIVGAGESLANWWLKHPEVPRQEVADWYVGLAQAAITAAGQRVS